MQQNIGINFKHTAATTKTCLRSCQTKAILRSGCRHQIRGNLRSQRLDGPALKAHSTCFHTKNRVRVQQHVPYAPNKRRGRVRHVLLGYSFAHARHHTTMAGIGKALNRIALTSTAIGLFGYAADSCLYDGKKGVRGQLALRRVLVCRIPPSLGSPHALLWFCDVLQLMVASALSSGTASTVLNRK